MNYRIIVAGDEDYERLTAEGYWNDVCIFTLSDESEPRKYHIEIDSEGHSAGPIPLEAFQACIAEAIEILENYDESIWGL